MNVRTVSELSDRINRLEEQVAADRQLIESQREAIGLQQAMLQELTDAYDLFESAMIEIAQHGPEPSSRAGRPNLHVLH